MRKQIIALILIAAIMPLIAFADDTYNSPIFGKYGFTNHESYDSFQQYIGKTVMTVRTFLKKSSESFVITKNSQIICK